jgi:hypothetical protein
MSEVRRERDQALTIPDPESLQRWLELFGKRVAGAASLLVGNLLSFRRFFDAGVPIFVIAGCCSGADNKTENKLRNANHQTF